jgi:hypothetical protein
VRAAALAGLALLAGCGAEPVGGTSWHVDYERGSDAADGRTPETAWKRAPGDPAATGRAAAAKLLPGDTVLFRGGVAYRGTIRLAASGAAGKPITWSGLGYGEGMGAIDGADPVRLVRACRDAADCGFAADWKGLSRIEYSQPPTARIVLFGKSGRYFVSQVPALPEPFFGDDRQNFEVVPRGELAALGTGLLRAPGLLAAARRGGGRMEIAFWVRPNQVERRPVLAVEAEGLRFDPGGLRFYEDRDGRAALDHSFAGLGQPGFYADVAPGVLVARLRPGDSAATLSIGSGRVGIELGGQRFVTISGLDFRNFAGSEAAAREGRAITSFGPGASDIEVRGNRFGPALIAGGSGMVHLFGTTRFRFLDNRMEDVFGAGFRAGGGSPGELLIEGNVFRRIGRTAIGLLGVKGAVVRGNILTDIRGVHGNAITAYLGNEDILIEGNCVVASSRPLTFHGDGKGTVNRIRIVGNILVSSGTGQAAINSWGRQTTDVEIVGNLLAGPKHGVLLNGSDRAVVVKGNDTSGIARADRAGADWVIEGNREDLTLAAAGRGRFSEEGCAAPAGRPALSVARGGF